MFFLCSSLWLEQEMSETPPQTPPQKRRPGAPKGNKNAMKHGRYCAERRALFRRVRALTKQARVIEQGGQPLRPRQDRGRARGGSGRGRRCCPRRPPRGKRRQGGRGVGEKCAKSRNNYLSRVGRAGSPPPKTRPNRGTIILRHRAPRSARGPAMTLCAPDSGVGACAYGASSSAGGAGPCRHRRGGLGA